MIATGGCLLGGMVVGMYALNDPGGTLQGLRPFYNCALAAFVVRRCSSVELGFIGGIDAIAGSSMSGCANITILYLPPLLVGVYLLALYRSVVSLWLGRGHSQAWWLGLVEGFHRRRLNAPYDMDGHADLTEQPRGARGRP